VLDSGLWSAHAPDTSLHRLRRTPTPELPDVGGERLADAWLRSAAGETRWLGAWERDLERPASSAGPGPPPPGWLLAGLPLGSVVLLARDSEGRWLRLTGLP